MRCSGVRRALAGCRRAAAPLLQRDRLGGLCARSARRRAVGGASHRADLVECSRSPGDSAWHRSSAASRRWSRDASVLLREQLDFLAEVFAPRRIALVAPQPITSAPGGRRHPRRARRGWPASSPSARRTSSETRSVSRVRRDGHPETPRAAAGDSRRLSAGCASAKRLTRSR